MSNVKERILGAVTVMNEADAEKVWKLIQATFALANAEEAEPEPDELVALKLYHDGDKDFQPVISQEDILRELGL